MIISSAVETHRFGRVRNNGYDPAEVDAVVGRLVEKLEEHHDRVTDLERKLDDSHVSAWAISRTLAAVEETKDQILTDAHTDAGLITARAHAEADEVVALASTLGAEISARRDAILTEAFREADAAVMASELKVADRESSAATTAATIIEDAVMRAEETERRAAGILQDAMMNAAWQTTESERAARTRLANAEIQAAAIIEHAEHESERLLQQVNDLRLAVANLRSSAADLARTTVSGAEVIDLVALAARDISREEPAPVLPLNGTVKPEPATLPTAVAPEPDDPPVLLRERRASGIKERITFARLIN